MPVIHMMPIQTTAQDVLRLVDDAKAERRRRKETERVLEDRVLDAWERYRALNDHCDRLLDLTELYDRKTRFALLILGGLNAINLFIAMRTDVVGLLQRGNVLIGAYVACYVVLSLGMLLYAISALRPRTQQDDAVDDGQTLDEYCERWRDRQIGQMNRELAATAYLRTQTNAVQLRALHHVYCGLYVLVVLAACFGGLGLAGSW